MPKAASNKKALQLRRMCTGREAWDLDVRNLTRKVFASFLLVQVYLTCCTLATNVVFLLCHSSTSESCVAFSMFVLCSCLALQAWWASSCCFLLAVTVPSRCPREATPRTRCSEFPALHVFFYQSSVSSASTEGLQHLL